MYIYKKDPETGATLFMDIDISINALDQIKSGFFSVRELAPHLSLKEQEFIQTSLLYPAPKRKFNLKRVTIESSNNKVTLELIKDLWVGGDSNIVETDINSAIDLALEYLIAHEPEYTHKDFMLSRTMCSEDNGVPALQYKNQDQKWFLFLSKGLWENSVANIKTPSLDAAEVALFNYIISEE
jgi:hypothetical protein